MLPDDSSGVEDGDDNAVNNESRIHELVNIVESSGKFHEAVESESLSGRADDDFVASDERISDGYIESRRIIDDTEVISRIKLSESLLELKLASRLVESDINRAETFVCADEVIIEEVPEWPH